MSSEHYYTCRKKDCFYCPNAKKAEILALSEDEKERVKFIEANAKGKVNLKGLGRNHYSWTDLLNADQEQQKMFKDYKTTSVCGCMDN